VWLSWPRCSWWQEVHGRLAILDALAADWELRTGRCIGAVGGAVPGPGPMRMARRQGGSVTRAKAWVGVDAGKRHHWAVVLDPDGAVLLSRRVANDE
jgi:hypothetical protein